MASCLNTLQMMKSASFSTDQSEKAGAGSALTENKGPTANRTGDGVQQYGEALQQEVDWDWNNDRDNPYNWPAGMKWRQVAMLSSFALLATLGTSILSPAHAQIMEEFNVGTTRALLPLSLYTFALSLGPVLGGPLSETVGRYPVFVGLFPVGALFTLGVGFCHSFAGVCVLRFLAAFCFSPSLSVSSGTLNETFRPVERGLPSTLFIMAPFLGPGIGPVIGGFIVSRKGWRWTQWAMLFFVVLCMALALLFGRETYHPVLKRRKAARLGRPLPPRASLLPRARAFLTVALLRPVHMLLTEPIVTFTCLYVACEVATQFAFFAAVPYVFGGVYGFAVARSGLVFASLVVGTVLAALTVVLCDVLFYRAQVRRHPPHRVPPEYRLLPAMVGSLGLPAGLFWFAWTARADVSWASPAAAIVSFGWGNTCIFISTTQYITDTYHGTTVASAASANSLSRYALAGGFPLFTIQMYQRLGIAWSSSLLGFVALALLPVPWVLFKFGKTIRSKSQYETASY